MMMMTRRESFLCAVVVGCALATTFASCSPDTENIFGDSPATRQQQASSQYYKILENSEYGWAVDFYPSGLEYGGIAYTARFLDGRVTLACEQAINNKVVGGRYDVGQEVTSDYRIINGQGVMLTFDTYNALMHYWSQPSGTDFDGFASDYEFTFVSASADEVLLRGVKHGNLMRMYPLKESSGDYINKVVSMRATLSESTRKRVVVDGETMPVTAMENHMEYSADGKAFDMPYVYTDKGLRFYQPVELKGVSVLEMQYDEPTKSLRSADGQMTMPAPTSLERFCGATTQWHFVYGKTDDSYEMCDELRTIVKQAVSDLGKKFESLKDMYIGLNKLSREEDPKRIVIGWTSAYSSWAYEVCYGLDMTVLDEQAGTIAIRATESGNLYYNYTLFQPILDFVVAGSPYVLTFDNADSPTSVTLTSQQDASRWFRVKM